MEGGMEGGGEFAETKHQPQFKNFDGEGQRFSIIFSLSPETPHFSLKLPISLLPPPPFTSRCNHFFYSLQSNCSGAAVCFHVILGAERGGKESSSQFYSSAAVRCAPRWHWLRGIANQVEVVLNPILARRRQIPHARLAEQKKKKH